VITLVYSFAFDIIDKCVNIIYNCIFRISRDCGSARHDLTIFHYGYPEPLRIQIHIRMFVCILGRVSMNNSYLVVINALSDAHIHRRINLSGDVRTHMQTCGYTVTRRSKTDKSCTCYLVTLYPYTD